MASSIPIWLNAFHVQRVLRCTDQNDESIEVSDMSVTPACTKGDNYASDIYRVTVDLQRLHKIKEKISVIVKVSPQTATLKKMIAEVGFFETELSMMSVILPRIKKILAALSIAQITPCCLYTQYEEPVHMFMEDLVQKGFRMAVPQKGLDLDHCLLVMQSLALFHASSVALREKNLKILDRYKKGMLHKEHPSFMVNFYNMGVKALADETAKWHELNPRITEKLMKLSKVAFEKGCEAAKCKKDDFNVLNHGDFRINNMMFRYDEQGKPVDLMLVDFQISHQGSPAEDILFFFGTSTTYDIRHHHRERLLRKYHESLTNMMIKLKCSTEVISFGALQDALKERAFLEVIASMTTLSRMMHDDRTNSEGVDIVKTTKVHEEYQNIAYSGRSYRNIMTILLPLYDSMGLLDV